MWFPFQIFFWRETFEKSQIFLPTILKAFFVHFNKEFSPLFDLGWSTVVSIWHLGVARLFGYHDIDTIDIFVMVCDKVNIIIRKGIRSVGTHGTRCSHQSLDFQVITMSLPEIFFSLPTSRLWLAKKYKRLWCHVHIGTLANP